MRPELKCESKAGVKRPLGNLKKGEEKGGHLSLMCKKLDTIIQERSSLQENSGIPKKIEPILNRAFATGHNLYFQS